MVIDILDDEQDGQLILWDNVCSPLLGITASELKGKYSEEGCTPNEIEGLIGKTMKFMIVTREDQFKYRGNAAFTVLGVQADEAISNSFKKGEQGSVIRKLAEEKNSMKILDKFDSTNGAYSRPKWRIYNQRKTKLTPMEEYAVGLAVGISIEDEIFFCGEKMKKDTTFKPAIEEDVTKKKVDS
nr:replication factor A protein 1-like [Ipomoea batatas]